MKHASSRQDLWPVKNQQDLRLDYIQWLFINILKRGFFCPDTDWFAEKKAAIKKP